MIKIVTKDNAGRYVSDLHQMHRLRKMVFRDRLGWATGPELPYLGAFQIDMDGERYMPLPRRPLQDIDLDTPIPTTDQPFWAIAAVWNSLQR